MWITIGVATLLAIVALLLLPPHAHGNFVYWTNSSPGSSIGRAKINGSGVNDNFITGLSNPNGVAVDSKFVYWAETGANRIGRANLDSTAVNPNFITSGVTSPLGVAITSNAGIFWRNGTGMSVTIGHANADGSNPVANFISPVDTFCGIAADQSFVYWLDNDGPGFHIGRAPVSGGAPDSNFINVPSAGCGVAVDNNFLYWDAGLSRV
ncbi:MAG TPA: hypothetical protein VKB00_07940, partial [Candidatus Limnocylindrales bacterium]|nr:hypothetical protein [Candidatus Limnocylindrales bacterium]